jgi:predicted nucleotidyltransferase
MPLDYRNLFKGMNEAGIDYMLVGGVAVNFYGIPRMTYDLDLMIALNPENILKLLARLNDWGYKPRAPVNPNDLADEKKRAIWIRDKNMKAFSFYHEKEAIGEIDVLIVLPMPYEKFRERAKVFDLEGTSVPVVSVQDLIDLKRRAGRQQDVSDVEHLKAVLEKK